MANLKKTENWFSRPLSLNAGQKYGRILQGENKSIAKCSKGSKGEHSAILLTIKLPFVIKIFFGLFLSGRFTPVLLYGSIYNWYTIIIYSVSSTSVKEDSNLFYLHQFLPS